MFNAIVQTVVAGLLLAATTGLWATMRTFIREQRKVNEANKDFMRSMQRAEINRYFRIVVEQGNPVSPEELAHLEACYESYHANGGNGTGTIMYERILDNARIVTQVKEEER